MKETFLQRLKSSKGLSLVTLIIIAAFIFGAFNAYAYFNPDFELSRFSVVRFLRASYDTQRMKDLDKIREAVEAYRDDNDEYPAQDGWCGRIISLLNPEVKDALLPYFDQRGIPQDPAFSGTNKDYFYRREDEDSFVLMAVLENAPEGTQAFNYQGCYDWPGDGVYNYRILVR